ncbi:MAG: glycoside hydrolase domain-containing protein, partial [Allomuricauda sp.]
NAWQYTFMVSHDAKGLMKLMGGGKAYSRQLQNVFDKNQFDMANEPDIAYPYLFNYVKGEEWRTQQTVSDLLQKYFKNSSDGLPGNDDTGTMSAWAVFSMMGIYPVNPAQPIYALTRPKFDKITIHLDAKYYPNQKVIISTKSGAAKKSMGTIVIDGKKHNSYFLSHQKLTHSKSIEFR